MRKALTMLGAIAALALGSLFAAAPAQAAITCSRINTNPTATSWPEGDWGMKCVNSATPTFPTQTNGNNMLSAIPGVGQDELRRSPNRNFTKLNGVRYYLFHTAADYNTWAASNGGAVSHTAADFGVTKVDPRGVPVYSAIWEINGLNETTNIRRAVGTQMGISLDYLYGYIKNGGIVPTTRFRFSDTVASPANAWQNIFKQNLDRDWALFTGAPCKIGSAFGLFSKFADNRLPESSSTYICTDDTGTSGFGDGTALSATYASLPACVGVPPTGSAACNKAIVIQAWPELYGDIHALFAQEYAFMNVANDQSSSGRTRDVYLNGRFTCSKMMLRMAAQGKLPAAGDLTAAETSAACIVPSMTTKCVKLFSGHTGQFPDGNVFNCMPPSTPVNTTALASQQQFAKLGGITYTSIKDKLDLERADVYFFPDDATYTNAFDAAGVVRGTLFNKCGQTAPDGAASERIWRSVMNHSCATASTSSKQTYVATHELGHVIDLTHALGQQSSRGVFDLALQIDLYRLNYTSWTSPTVNTPRLPCGSGAPLAGEVDSVGVAFCNGASLSSKYSALTGDTISNILRADRLDEMSYQSSSVVGPPGQTIPVAAGWFEYFAQGFAVRATIPMSAASNMPYLDSLIQKLANSPNGWFACTLGPRGSAPKGYLQLLLENPSADIQFANLGPACQFSALPSGWVNIR